MDEHSAKRKRTSLPDDQSRRKRARLPTDLSITAMEDSRIIEDVESRYDVQIHSIISSSKIQKKVASVLRHLTNESDILREKQQPRVSVLRAKAADAGKLVNIAEIAKRELASDSPSRPENSDGDAADNKNHLADSDGHARWFQYIVLGEEVKETPKDKSLVEETVLGQRADSGKDARTEEDNDDDFEVMKTPFERAIEGRPQKRKVPIMSLFLSRTPIDELRRRFGEQTNAAQTKEAT